MLRNVVCAMEFGMGDKFLFVLGKSVPHPLLVYDWKQGVIAFTFLVFSVFYYLDT